MNRYNCLLISLLTFGLFEQPLLAQWNSLQRLSGNNSIGSPGGTHPLVTDGTTVHAVWYQGGGILYRRSADAGRTWTDPLALTTKGAAQYPCSLELSGRVLHLIW